MLASRLQSVATNSGGGDLLLNVIAAAVIGGTSLIGGEGTVLGVVFGAMIMVVVSTGMTMMGIPGTWQKCVIGAIIILAAVIDVVRRKRSA